MNRMLAGSYYPILHELSDMKFFGRAHCGHEQVDVELRNPFLPEPNAISGPFPDPNRFLVSLPMLARWHTSEDFPAEEMLRESGKFDFSEPQFFHMFHKKVQIVNYFHAFSPNRNTNQTQIQKEVEKYVQYFCWTFERCATKNVIVDSKCGPLVVYKSSMCCSDRIIAWGVCIGRYMHFHNYFGDFVYCLENLNTRCVKTSRIESHFKQELSELFERGADLNRLLVHSEIIGYENTFRSAELRISAIENAISLLIL